MDQRWQLSASLELWLTEAKQNDDWSSQRVEIMDASLGLFTDKIVICGCSMPEASVTTTVIVEDESTDNRAFEAGKHGCESLVVGGREVVPSNQVHAPACFRPPLFLASLSSIIFSIVANDLQRLQYRPLENTALSCSTYSSYPNSSLNTNRLNPSASRHDAAISIPSSSSPHLDQSPRMQTCGGVDEVELH